METKIIGENRKNGIYYTPTPLAEHLVDPLIHSINQTVFDPAYGDGALLIAAEKALRKRANGNRLRIAVYGCDRQPVNGRLSHLPGSNLLKQDFFDHPLMNKYDVILMNPPFIRHHLINNKERKKYQNIVSPVCHLKSTSDLWAYFLVKAVSHLKEGGSIGAILPWSFLQAGYAAGIRRWLLDKFEKINVLALGCEYFIGTEERVLLVWLKNYGQNARSIKISYSREIKEKSDPIDLDDNAWNSSPVLVSKNFRIGELLKQYVDEYNFLEFGDIADVQIGVVTGADDFFILQESEAKRQQFRDDQLIPILSSAKQFSGLILNGKKELKRLVTFSGNNRDYEVNYIKKGEKLGYCLRAHSRLRSPWYVVKVGGMPDGFFPYRMAHIPYLMLNNQAQCTNSIHRIYFRDLSENEMKWAQVSLLAVPRQLALESYAKTYGRGLLKIEPGALKKAIVYISNDPGINPLYKTISQLISTGQKFEAMIMATKFLNERLNIERSHSNAAHSALRELQNRRLNK